VRALVRTLTALAALAVAGPALTAAQEKAPTIELELKDGKGMARGDITAQDARDRVRAGSYCKVYTVKLAAGRVYRIDMRSTALDAYLRLEEPDGRSLAQDDDSGGNLNARITFNCPRAGTYRILATTYRGGATGAFDLSVQDQSPAATLQLTDGRAEVRGTLSLKDTRDTVRLDSRCKVYPIQMTAGRTYRIEMVSSKLDSYLRVEGPDGKQVAQDDDGGGGRNARVMYRCPADGVYRIIATTYASQVGPFTLTVQEQR
jgi:serine protease Do